MYFIEKTIEFDKWLKKLNDLRAKGYRIYFKETDGKIIILLIGGDKSTQQKNIEKAKELSRAYHEHQNKR
jgi:putative component of toxin-antitoxin plasmid stabilization module